MADPNIAPTHATWRAIDYKPKSGDLLPVALLELCAQGVEVLDVGCGKGALALEMAKRGARVTGVDINADAIEEARRRAGEAGLADQTSFETVDVVSGGLPAKPFGLVATVRFLTCVPEPASWDLAVAALHSALTPGGILYVHDFAVFPEGYGQRYATGLDLGWGYGVFRAPAGDVSFVAKHHTDAEIDKIAEGLDVERRTFTQGRSMNGNACLFFELIARKPL